MKVGDLVKPSWSWSQSVVDKVFLVTEWRINWIKVLGCEGWYRITDWEVISDPA